MIQQLVNGFTRKIEWIPAFDKRNPEPGNNYGVHCVEMRWYLIGEKGAIQFVLYTGWHLPHVLAEHKFNGHLTTLMKPRPADIGYHSPVPMYEDQAPMSGECNVIGGTCYYDGSTLNAERFFDLFVKEGDEAVWKLMEGWYESQFSEAVAQETI